jgi:transcriptional regulator with GAF, ATPase, and Fis domain
LITSPEGCIEIESMLRPSAAKATPVVNEQRILSENEMDELQIANIKRALAACKGQVSGRHGAAELLGIPATTLSSRIRKLGIQWVQVVRSEDQMIRKQPDTSVQ